VAARGRTAQRGYRLVKAREDLLRMIGCPKTFDQTCANKIRRYLVSQGCNARYVWGTYAFLVSDCNIPQGFQLLEPLDFHSLTEFATDDIEYVFHGVTSKKPSDLLRYGPNQFPRERVTFKVFYFSEETLDMFRSVMQPVTVDGEEALKAGDYYIYLAPTSITSEESLGLILTRPKPAILLVDEELESFGDLKRKSLQKSERGYFSTLQVIKRDTLEKILAGSNLAKLYMRVNVLSALVTKSGGVPYRLRILAKSDFARTIARLLNGGVFIGIAIGRPQGDDRYYKAVASIITADLTVKLYYHPILKGSSLEMSLQEIESFVNILVKELRDLAASQSIELVAIFRTRRFKYDEGEILLDRLRDRLFKNAKRLGEQPVILAIGVSKYMPLLAEGGRDTVWVVENVVEDGEEHGILLYKFRGFKNTVRIEYRAGGALEKIGIGEGERNAVGLVLAAYEYTRRLDITSPYPIKQRMLPAPIKFAKRLLKWII